jgi:hypothetical protein
MSQRLLEGNARNVREPTQRRLPLEGCQVRRSLGIRKLAVPAAKPGTLLSQHVVPDPTHTSEDMREGLLLLGGRISAILVRPMHPQTRIPNIRTDVLHFDESSSGKEKRTRRREVGTNAPHQP